MNWKLPKRVWLTASGLFLLPFGILISSVYIVTSLLFLKKPTLDHEANDIIKDSMKRVVQHPDVVSS